MARHGGQGNAFTSSDYTAYYQNVAAANLAGRTLAELILEQKTHRTSLPLVGKPFPKWEPEPLRSMGYAALTRFAEALDSANLHGRPTPRIRGAVYNHFVRK